MTSTVMHYFEELTISVEIMNSENVLEQQVDIFKLHWIIEIESSFVILEIVTRSYRWVHLGGLDHIT